MDCEIVSNVRHFFHHAYGRAVFFDGKAYRFFNFDRIYFAKQVEMHVNIGKHAGMGVYPVAAHGDPDIPQFLPLPAHDVDDVYRATGTYAGEHELHGAHALVGASDIRGSVDIDRGAQIAGSPHVKGSFRSEPFYVYFHGDDFFVCIKNLVTKIIRFGF